MSKGTEDQSEENENLPNIQQIQSKDDAVKPDDDRDEEDEGAYRLRVYGYNDVGEDLSSSSSTTVTGKTTLPLSESAIRNNNDNVQKYGPLGKHSKRFSKRLSHSLVRRSSSFKESLPNTPRGWAVLSSVVLSAILAYEVKLQKSLTKPPITFSQLPSGSLVEKIYEELTEKSSSVNTHATTKILSRCIHPSLFVGTRSAIASTAVYIHGGPSSSSRTNFVRFREIFTMSQDGTEIAIDWEFRRDQRPKTKAKDEEYIPQNEIGTSQQEILHGVICQPVVIILHGINNDSSFGYMKSLSRSFCKRGYISASMNARGCGGHKLRTPRCLTAAHTNDLRSLVRQISARLAENVSVFIVGNSLGANIMTKYFGEEGMAGTLPLCVSGGASLGNPLLINAKIVHFPLDILMAFGVKSMMLANRTSLNGMKDAHYKEILKKTYLAPGIADLDNAAAPFLIRNNPRYPFENRIGYDDGEAYWFDSSSYRYIRHISVPFLNITAQDDFLVSEPSRNKLGFCIANPNVMNVETRCGGHLGWQEAPPNSTFGASSWADTATSDFFDAILKVKMESSSEKADGHIIHPGTKFNFDFPDSLDFERENMDKRLKDIQREAIAFTKTNFSKL
uniref:Serine aminopeptidase S33 domain-containing protein n=1 Tax=Pseudo-nitzschia australis TaxID=44445 RepID=A0A7S4ER24_9STRA|mmetsp:Transcript_18192/g.39652  ORF Transcript_18192/g.39652 Transcript_18192/m.39652 type:complete len:619 (+) Transcript_18192:107-1963(+)